MHDISANENTPAGEAIAGIRYRARKLSASLHPTIPVHTPLTFDLFDTWKGKSVGRCAYYASPPDGTIYTARPIDAREASERRLARFVAFAPLASTPLPVAEHNPVYPMTLDLRWPAPDHLARANASAGMEGSVP